MITSWLPVLFTLALATLLGVSPMAKSYAEPFLPLAPWLVLVGGLMLAWRFNRSRLAYSLCLLMATGCILRLAETNVLSHIYLDWCTLLLPISLAILVVLPERGFLTVAGILRPTLLVLLATGAALLTFWQTDSVERLFELVLLPAMPKLLPLPADPVLVTWILVLTLLGWWAWRNPSPLELGLLTSLVLCYPALYCPGPLSPETWLALAGLAPTLAIIEMSHLMAFRDDLTGLPGRRALNEALQRLGGQYTIAMLDIDHFKKFNDRHGHDVGDQVLRMVAGKIGRVSGGGKAFRYGGEEFSIIFSGQSLHESLPYLEEVRKAVELASFTTRRRWQRPKKKPATPKPSGKTNQSLKVTISIGVSERIKPMSPAQVIKAADKALYKAKKAGRNRVCS